MSGGLRGETIIKMSFVSIIAQIKLLLEAITDIKEVYDYDRGTFSGYPAAVIYPTENKNDFETTTQNRVQYVFTIRLHEPMESTSATDHAKADRILREVVDKVIAKFDKNYTLNNAVHFCYATPSVWGYQTRETGAVRVAEIKLTCVKLQTI